MKRYILICLVCISGILASCGSVELLTFDQLRPAELTFPSDVRYVGVANNVPYRTEASKKILTFGILKGDGKMSAEALAGALADSKYFDQVVISDSALQPKTAELDSEPVELSTDKVQQLIADLNVDLLVVFDNLWVNTSRQQIYYPGFPTPYPAIQAKVKSSVRLFLKGRSQPMTTLTDTDSLYWNADMVVSEYDILKETALWSATKMANKLVPYWEKIDRPYFAGGCVEMRDAKVCVNEGDWKEAQEIWKGLYDRLKKGTTKARAAYNVALSYEMEGNIEKAEEWINTALGYVDPESEEHKLFKLYLSDLAGHKNTLFHLNQQMKRFNNNF